MRIERNIYVQRLIDRMGNGLIKVITGIRRSGKSYLLFNLFQEYLHKQGIPADHIISMAFDTLENREYRNPETLMAYIRQRLGDSGVYYVLLDEVQMLDHFEEVLNSLLHKPNVDLYVTGSNSRFLSKDVLTELRGRGDEIHIFPLSFQEFMQAYPGDMYHGWAEYVMYGGLPLTVTMKTDEQKSQYLEHLFQETYLKDIKERNHIEREAEMENLLDVLASSIGSLTNPSKIQETFTSRLKSSISVNTVHRYISYLEDAFLIHEAKRYDVKGRKYIGTPMKYYFEDVGLRNARLNFRQQEPTHIMENIVYNELCIRGYHVDVGIVEAFGRDSSGKRLRKQLEVDFVVNQASQRYYIQVAYDLASEEKQAQEFNSLRHIPDSFKKIVIVNGVRKPWRNDEGFVIMGMKYFLLNADSLKF